MKKLFMLIIMGLVLCSTNAFAFNPNTFEDQEEVNVNGRRPKVEIAISEYIVTIEPEDFDETGIALKEVDVDNTGNVPCHLEVTVKKVPVDLDVIAEVDDDFLLRGESTTLKIEVELSDQQDAETFEFIIVIRATLLP